MPASRFDSQHHGVIGVKGYCAGCLVRKAQKLIFKKRLNVDDLPGSEDVSRLDITFMLTLATPGDRTTQTILFIIYIIKPPLVLWLTFDVLSKIRKDTFVFLYLISGGLF